MARKSTSKQTAFLVAARITIMSLVFLASCFAQVSVLKYAPKSKVNNGTYAEISLPFVESDNPGVAWRINELIYQYRFHRRAPKSVNEAAPDFAESSTALETSFNVIRNDSKVVSLRCQVFSCGASCASSTSYFVFDPTTGRQIKPQDLFTKEGCASFSKRMMRYWKSVPDQQDPYHDPFQRRYEGFLEFISEEFAINDSQVVFYLGNGNRHVSYDSLAFKFDSLQNYLNDFGKRVLFGRPANATQPNNLIGQLFKGTIGKSPVVVILDIFENHITGFYYYEKYGEHLPFWDGTVNGNQLILPVSVQNPELIKARIGLKSLVGTWSCGEKSLPFSVSLE